MADLDSILRALVSQPQPEQPTTRGILDALMTTWPARAGQGILQGLMAPGNAYRSTPDNPVTTEQMIGPAAELAGVMTGTPGGVGGYGSGARLPRLQSTPIVRINGENYIGYTHEGALERAAKSRGLNESVNDLVDGLGGWNKVRDNHFGYLNAADEFIPIRDAMDPTKYR